VSGKRFRRICEVAALPWSVIGRARLRAGLRFRVGRITFGPAGLYRRTWIRGTRIHVIIGSFGKTTTTRAVAAVLGHSPSAAKGWNAGGFLAEFLFRVHRGQATAVSEVGVRVKGEMAMFARLLRPDVVIVTSIGTEHHRTLGSLPQIREEKAQMLKMLPRDGMAVLNADDPNVRWMGGGTRAAVRTYGFDAANDVWASGYEATGLSGARFVLHTESVSRLVATQLVGRHMVYPLLAAAAVGLAEGVDLEAVISAIEGLAPCSHRLQAVHLPGGPGLLMDDYKTVLETVGQALDTVSELPARRRIVVLGEIYEPPDDESQAYRQVGCHAAQVADRVVFVGGTAQFRNLCEGAARNGTQQVDIAFAGRSVLRAAKLAGEDLTPDDIVLVKAPGYQRLERLRLLLGGERVTCDRETCKAPITYSCATCRHLSHPHGRHQGAHG
jgi:UDP-N-acetylmuramoyl-tripeptide--D-alanyl-D-alanine ligase